MYSKAQLYFLASYSGQVNYKDEAHQNGQGHGFSFRVKQRMMKTEITYSSLVCSLKESGSQFSKFVGIIGSFESELYLAKIFIQKSLFNLLL